MSGVGKTIAAGIAEAARLRLAHGPRAEQHLVDRMQHALRAGDEAAAQHCDRVLRLLQRNR